MLKNVKKNERRENNGTRSKASFGLPDASRASRQAEHVPEVGDQAHPGSPYSGSDKNGPSMAVSTQRGGEAPFVGDLSSGSARSKVSYSILRLPAVKSLTGLSRSTIYLRISYGQFPKAVSLGARAVGWVESEIQDWLEQRISASRAQ